jgi:hypothetical protein
VRDDVPHPAHLAEGEFRDGQARGVAQVDGGFANDFQAADDGILLLGAGRVNCSSVVLRK